MNYFDIGVSGVQIHVYIYRSIKLSTKRLPSIPHFSIKSSLFVVSIQSSGFSLITFTQRI